VGGDAERGSGAGEYVGGGYFEYQQSRDAGADCVDRPREDADHVYGGVNWTANDAARDGSATLEEMAGGGLRMKIAHVVVVTPHLAGIYETTRDLVAAERGLGIDARLVDPKKPGVGEDRGVPIAGHDFVSECQVVVNHSGLSKELDGTRLPIVHVMHGRPLSSFLHEQEGRIPVYSYLRRVREDARFKAFVTFWPEYVPYWSVLLPREKLHAIEAPVDLERWTPDGPRGYTFRGHKGEINVVCASVWRHDENPYHIVHAFRLFATWVQGARLHIYAAPQTGSGWAVLKECLQREGILGEVVGFVKGLENVYRAADVAITPHHIATRSVREALACGCNVVMASDNLYTRYAATPEKTWEYASEIRRAVEGKAPNREVAETFFDSRRIAEQFMGIVEGVL